MNQHIKHIAYLENESKAANASDRRRINEHIKALRCGGLLKKILGYFTQQKPIITGNWQYKHDAFKRITK